MATKNRLDRRCSYVVPFERTVAGGDLREFASYLSSLSSSGCEVIVLDGSEPAAFEENQRVLRWVSRHARVGQPYDAVHAAVEAAGCDKIIVAGEDVRYESDDIVRICGLLDAHDVVEPEEYVSPLTWWGAVDAGRSLVQRAVQPSHGRGATFALRRSSLRPLRRAEEADEPHPVQRLAESGAAVFSPDDFFVRRCPPALRQWIAARARRADSDLAVPLKAVFFFALVPVAALIAMAFGGSVAVGFTGALAFASILLALRGRAGREELFPLRTCFFAPLGLLERSLTIYVALASRFRHVGVQPAGSVVAQAAKAKVASGE